MKQEEFKTRKGRGKILFGVYLLWTIYLFIYLLLLLLFLFPFLIYYRTQTLKSSADFAEIN